MLRSGYRQFAIDVFRQWLGRSECGSCHRGLSGNQARRDHAWRVPTAAARRACVAVSSIEADVSVLKRRGVTALVNADGG